MLLETTDTDLSEENGLAASNDNVLYAPSGNLYTITFAASLPCFHASLETAKFLPITAVKLNERLDMLGKDANLVRHFECVLFGYTSENDDIFLDRAEKLLELAGKISKRTCEASRFFIQKRLLIALVRSRLRGNGVPESFERWKKFLTKEIYERIEENKNDPDFGLARLLPFMPKLREHLEKEEIIESAWLVLKWQWDYISDLNFDAGFDMEAILLYVMKWHVMRLWLTHKPEESLEMINKEIDRIFENTEIDYEHKRAK